MDLSDIKALIKDTGLYGTVEDAVSFAHAANSGIGNANARAWVMVTSERAEDNNTIGGAHRQREKVRLAVLFVVKAASAKKDRSDVIEAHKAALKSKLAGYAPADAESPLQYKAGNLRDLSKGLIWFECLFDTDRQFTSDN